MKKRLSELLFAFTLSTMVLSGCGSSATNEVENSNNTEIQEEVKEEAQTETKEEVQEDKKVITATGEREPIGSDYGNLVVSDMKVLEHLMALDITPAAAVYPAYHESSVAYVDGFYRVYPNGEFDDIPQISQYNQPDIEVILSHSPDYIIASSSYVQHAEKLEAVADTYYFEAMLDEDGIDDWRPYLRNIGVLFDAEDKVDEIIKEYDAVVEETLELVGDMIEGKSAMVIGVAEKGISYRSAKNYAGLYKELGFELPKDIPELGETSTIAVEAIVEIDPDFIFISEVNVDMIEELMETPIWGMLKAVQNDNVMYFSHFAWTQTCGPISDGLEITETRDFLLSK